MAANHKLKEQLDRARSELQLAQRDGNLARAGELAHGAIPTLEARLAESDQQGAGSLTGTAVLDSDVASVVARWTGIPTENLLASEAERLVRLESVLQSRVVGQDDALSAVANAVRRAKAGLQDPNRPLGSFLFLGPTGVGKTELAKALAEFLFSDERALLRFDMSEYMERHSVARMLGCSAGVRRLRGRRHAYGSRAAAPLPGHPIRRNREGAPGRLQRAAPGPGRRVPDRWPGPCGQLPQYACDLDLESRRPSFSVTIQWMPRPSGSPSWRPSGPSSRPEFLNRLDEIILFRSLAAEHMGRIVNIQLDRLIKRGVPAGPRDRRHRGRARVAGTARL